MTDDYALARQARDAGDRHWRDFMPWHWHLRRYWSIWWPVHTVCAVLLAAGVIVLWVAL